MAICGDVFWRENSPEYDHNAKTEKELKEYETKILGAEEKIHQIESHLFSKAVKKKSGRKRGISVSIDGRTFIEQRPKRVEGRAEFGHFEGDFIESGKDGTGSLLVLVERKTRYP